MNTKQLRKKAKPNKKVSFNNNFSRYQDSDPDLLALKAENSEIAENLKNTNGWEFNIVKTLSDLFADDVKVLETITIGSNIQAQSRTNSALNNILYLTATGRSCSYSARQYYDAFGIIPCRACDGLPFDSPALFTCLDSEPCESQGPFGGGFPSSDCVANSCGALEDCAGDCSPGITFPLDPYYDIALIGVDGPTGFTYIGTPSGPYGLVTYWQSNARGPRTNYSSSPPEIFSNMCLYRPTCIFTVPRRNNITGARIPDTLFGLGTKSSPYKYSLFGNRMRSPNPLLRYSLRTAFNRSNFPKYVYSLNNTIHHSDSLKAVSYTVPTTFKIRFITSDAVRGVCYNCYPGNIILNEDRSSEVIYKIDKKYWYIPVVIELNITATGSSNWVSGLGNQAVGNGESYVLCEDFIET